MSVAGPERRLMSGVKSGRRYDLRTAAFFAEYENL
jgi:hypothetical protein